MNDSVVRLAFFTLKLSAFLKALSLSAFRKALSLIAFVHTLTHALSLSVCIQALQMCPLRVWASVLDQLARRLRDSSMMTFKENKYLVLTVNVLVIGFVLFVVVFHLI